MQNASAFPFPDPGGRRTSPSRGRQDDGVRKARREIPIPLLLFLPEWIQCIDIQGFASPSLTERRTPFRPAPEKPRDLGISPRPGTGRTNLNSCKRAPCRKAAAVYGSMRYAVTPSGQPAQVVHHDLARPQAGRGAAPGGEHPPRGVRASHVPVLHPLPVPPPAHGRLRSGHRERG